MSIGFIDQVWKSDLTDIYEVSVLLALADHADTDGRCYPAVGNVAKKARCSKRKAQEVIKALCERGYLRVNANSGPRGCNTFYLMLPHAQDAPAHGVHPRTSKQKPPHTTTLPPACRAPEPSKKHQRNSARMPDLPDERQSDAADVQLAESIREGKPWVRSSVSAHKARQLVAAGRNTLAECQAAGVL